jgi:hypothetical protein
MRCCKLDFDNFLIGIDRRKSCDGVKFIEANNFKEEFDLFGCQIDCYKWKGAAQ